MAVAEFLIGLATIILGLALSNIASSIHRLALFGRKVRWAPEPILLTILLVLILVNVWFSYWDIRDVKSINEGRALITVAQLMTLYFAAASCLPEVDRIPEAGIDLKAYYYETRQLAYGAMVVSLSLIGFRALVGGGVPVFLEWLAEAAIPIILYLILCVIRWRWAHLGVLLLVNGIFGYMVATTTIS